MKEAVIQAKSYAKELYDDEDIQDLSLEEIDFDDTSDNWRVTLGYNTKRHSFEKNLNSPISEFINPFNLNQDSKIKTIREYKIFEINANNGNLIKMTIRKF